MSVFELNQAVDESFGVDEDLDFFVGKIEKIMSFDNFEAFVDEGGGVHEVFKSHVRPAGMGEDLFGGDVLELFTGFSEERTTRTSENDFLNVLNRMASKALENGGLLRVDGNDGGGGGVRGGTDRSLLSQG